MFDSLLTTKLQAPPGRPTLIPRPHLFHKLNIEPAGRLVLISAPAGFGKTTLVAEWLYTRKDALGAAHEEAEEATSPPSSFLPLTRSQVAWISLDTGDNDAVRFFSYVVAALQKIDARIGQTTAEMLQSPPLPSIETFMTTLVNEIAVMETPFVLVLDDYHHIQTGDIHQAITFLLDNMPRQMCLILITRADPPLPLSRLRARGQMSEIRADDLRFTVPEAAALLNDKMGLALPEGDVATLAARTEGWIAGLQLAALSMQGRDRGQNGRDRAEFIEAFTGSHHYILDYLADEVLSQRPQEIKDFLMQTSILERLTAPLCAAVTGQEDSQAALEMLERANLFIVPLDNKRQWYRYHHLFAEFLQARLRQTQPERLAELHNRAADWYEGQHLIPEAITHALAAENFTSAARLIDQVAWKTMMRGEIKTVMDWLEALPETAVRAWPRLSLAQVWALLFTVQPATAIEAHLQDAAVTNQDGTQTAVNRAEVQGMLTAIRALFAILQGDTATAADLIHQAQDRLPAEDPLLQSLLALNLGLTHLLEDNCEAARQAYIEAIKIGRKTDNILLAVMAMCQLAELHMLQGRLRQAAHIYRQAQALASDPAGTPLPIAAIAILGIAELLREWNNLQEAQEHLRRGVALGRPWGELWAFDAFIPLARIKQIQGDFAGALEEIHKARQLAQRFDITEIDDRLVEVYQAQLWLAQGDIEAATQWAQARRQRADKGSSANYPLSMREKELFVEARLSIAQGQAAKAVELLSSLLPATEDAGRLGRVIEGMVIKALALQALGEMDAAVAALAKALRLGEPQGYVRMFVDEGAPMATLLRETAVQRIRVDYVHKLLSILEAEEQRKEATEKPESVPAPSPEAPVSLLVEPLTEREDEVLQLIAGGLSNREIANELVVTLSTVKWHLNNLYGKLNVNSRTQAIARARELHLL